jgi:hypothetical protein
MKTGLLASAALLYMGIANSSAGAETQTIYLMAATSYPDNLPYNLPPPLTGWSSIGIKATENSACCEIIATDLRYIDKVESEGTVTVETTKENAGGLLIHGYPLRPGPVDCGVIILA